MIQWSPVPESKEEVDVSEFLSKISSDGNKINDLETKLSDLNKKYEKDTNDLRKRLKQAIKRSEITMDDLSVKVLAKPIKAHDNTPEIIAFLMIALTIISQFI